jgi:nickel/cobalt exporter
MLESAVYLISSFWLGAVHAATPGHGKTVAAAYLVGTRGRPADALALGIFVTLAHTSGVTVFALLAAFGSAQLSQRFETYASLAMALLILALGVGMLLQQWPTLRRAVEPSGSSQDAHAHVRELAPHTHFGVAHSHHVEEIVDARQRPSWGLLLGLGLAGGLLPDPAALAVLLAAIASGKLVLGLMTVLVFSLGFASVLVALGVFVGRFGQLVLQWTHSSLFIWLPVTAAIVITVVGAIMSVGAWRQIADWQ